MPGGSPFRATGFLGCSPFEAPSGQGDMRESLTFYRKENTQNSAGELIEDWVSVLTISGDLVPQGGNLVRYLHGELTEVPFLFIVHGTVDVRPSDRTYIPQPYTSAILVEAGNVNFFGVIQTEVDLRWVR